MRSKKKTTCRRTPASPLGGLAVFAKRIVIETLAQPMDAEHHGEACAAYYEALTALLEGRANYEQFNVLAIALNTGLVLAERGIGDEYITLFPQALTALVRAKNRHARSGKFGLDGEGIAALREVAGVYEEQIRIATHGEINDAEETMYARLKRGNEFKTERL